MFCLFCFIMEKSHGNLLCHFKRRYGKRRKKQVSKKFKDLLGNYVLDYRVKIFDTNKVLREKRKVKNYKRLIALEVLDRIWDLSAKPKDLIEIIKKIKNVKKRKKERD